MGFYPTPPLSGGDMERVCSGALGTGDEAALPRGL